MNVILNMNWKVIVNYITELKECVIIIPNRVNNAIIFMLISTLFTKCTRVFDVYFAKKPQLKLALLIYFFSKKRFMKRSVM